MGAGYCYPHAHDLARTIHTAMSKTAGRYFGGRGYQPRHLSAPRLPLYSNRCSQPCQAALAIIVCFPLGRLGGGRRAACLPHNEHKACGEVWQGLIVMFARLFSKAPIIAFSTLLSANMHILTFFRMNEGGVYAAACIKCEQYAAGENADGGGV